MTVARNTWPTMASNTTSDRARSVAGVRGGPGATGAWSNVGDGETTSFEMTSTFKLPVVLYVYTLRMRGRSV